MKNFNEQAEKLVRKRKNQKVWLGIVICLAVVVAAGVYFAFRFTGKAATGEGTDLSAYVTDANLEVTQTVDGDRKTCKFDVKFEPPTTGDNQIYGDNTKAFFSLPSSIDLTTISSPNGEVYDIKYNNGTTPAGTYVIGSDGVVQFTFEPDYLKKGPVSEINFSFQADVVRDVHDTTEQIDVVLGNKKITIPGYSHKEFTAHKSGQLSGDGKSITWTIAIDNPSRIDLKGYELTDTVFGPSVAANNVKVTVDGTEQAVGQYDQANKKYTFTESVDGKSIVLTYTQKLTNEDYMNAASTRANWGQMKNAAVLKGKDGFEKNLEAQVDYQLGYNLTGKSYKADYETGKLYWTFNVVDQFAPLTNFTFTDGAFSGLKPEDITYDYKEGETTKQGNLRDGPIFGSISGTKLTITNDTRTVIGNVDFHYNQTVEEGASGVNKISMEKEDKKYGEWSKEYEYNKETLKKEGGRIEYSSYVNWTITSEVARDAQGQYINHTLTGKVFKDEFLKGTDLNLSVVDDQGQNLVPGTDYRLDSSNGTLTILKEGVKKVVISYHTPVPAESNPNATPSKLITNKVEDDKKKDESSVKIDYKNEVSKGHEQITVDENGKVIVPWTVTLKQESGMFAGKSYIDTPGAVTYDGKTVEGAHEADLSSIKINYTAFDKNGQNQTTGTLTKDVDYQVIPASDGSGKFEIKFLDVNGSKFYKDNAQQITELAIQYNSKVDVSSVPEGNTVNIQNSGSFNGNGTEDHADHHIDEKEEVKKTAPSRDDVQVDGNIVTIPWQVKLTPKDGKFAGTTFTDIPTSGTIWADGANRPYTQVADADSVRVYYLSQNGQVELIKNTDYKIETGQDGSFTITFLGEGESVFAKNPASVTELYVSYNSTVDLSEIPAEAWVKVSNTAKFNNKQSSGEIDIPKEKEEEKEKVKKEVTNSDIVQIGEDTAVIPWTVTITQVEGVFAGKTFTDTPKGGTIQRGTTKYEFTQVSDAGSAKIYYLASDEENAEKVYLTSGVDYRVTPKDNGSFVVEFLGTEGSKFAPDANNQVTVLYIEYNSIVDYSNVPGNLRIEVYNKADFDGKVDIPKYEFDKEDKDYRPYNKQIVDGDKVSEDVVYSGGQLDNHKITKDDVEYYKFDYKITVEDSHVDGQDGMLIHDALPANAKLYGPVQSWYEYNPGKVDNLTTLTKSEKINQYYPEVPFKEGEGYWNNTYIVTQEKGSDGVTYDTAIDFFAIRAEASANKYVPTFFTYSIIIPVDKANEVLLKNAIRNTIQDTGHKFPEDTTSIETSGELEEVLDKFGDNSKILGHYYYQVEINPEKKILNGGENLRLEDIMYTENSFNDKGAFKVTLDSVTLYEYDKDATNHKGQEIPFSYTVDTTIPTVEEELAPVVMDTQASDRWAADVPLNAAKAVVTIQLKKGESIDDLHVKMGLGSGDYSPNRNVKIENCVFDEDGKAVVTYTGMTPQEITSAGNGRGDKFGVLLYTGYSGISQADLDKIESIAVTYTTSDNQYVAKLNGEVPDGKHLILEYSYYVPEATKDFHPTVVNEVKIIGTRYEAGHEDRYDWTNSSNATSSVESLVVIRKTDVSNYSSKLPAEINLYKWDGEGSRWLTLTGVEESKGNYKTTFSETGDPYALKLNSITDTGLKLDPGNLYKIVETKTPNEVDSSIKDQYIKLEEPRYFVFDPIPSNIPMTDPVDGTEIKYSTITGTGTYYLQNAKKIDISVDKKWLGTDWTNVEEVRVALYRSATYSADSIPANAVLVGDYTAGDVQYTGEVVLTGDKTSFTWKDLPDGSEQGTPYYYYVKEVSYTMKDGSQSYKPVYYGNGKNESGTVTVENAEGLVVTKKWLDQNNQVVSSAEELAELGLSSVKFDLYRSTRNNLFHINEDTATRIPSGSADGSYEISAANNWKYVFKNLADKNDAGEKLYYYVVEKVGKEENSWLLETAYSGNGAEFLGAITITNKVNIPDDTSVKVQKEWKLPTGTDTPAYIKFELKKTVKGVTTVIGEYKLTENSVSYASADSTNNKYPATLIEGKTWMAEITGLPKKDGNDDITYTVDETAVSEGDGEVLRSNTGDFKYQYSATQAEDGTWVLENIKAESFELPETGGRGMGLIYTIGAALILLGCASVLTMVFIKRR